MTERAGRAAWVLLAIPPLLWSTMIVVGRHVIGDIPPAALTFWTWLIAGVSLLPWTWRELAGGIATLRSELGRLVVFALTGVAVFQGFYYAGLERSTAVNASLLTPTLPIMVAVVAWFVLGERLRPLQLLGVALAMAGAGWIAVAGEWVNVLSLRLGTGELLILVANLSMAIYTVMLRRTPSRLPPLAFMAAISLIGAAVLLPVYALEAAGRGDAGRLADHWLALLYVGIVTYSLAYVMWSRSVALNGATLTAIFLYLIPVFGTGLAMLFLGEVLLPFHAVGVGLIFAGIYFSLHGPAPATN